MPDGSSYRPHTTDEDWNEQYTNASGVRNAKVEVGKTNPNWYQIPREGYRDYKRISGKSKFRRRGLKSAAQKKLKIGRGPTGAIEGAATKVRAVQASILVWHVGGWLYIGQFLFWGLSITALALEDTWLGFAIPGETAFYATWALAALFGCLAMVAGIGIYTAFRVNTFKAQNLTVFMICLILHIVPLVNFAPWGIFWTLFVIYYAGKSKK